MIVDYHRRLPNAMRLIKRRPEIYTVRFVVARQLFQSEIIHKIRSAFTNNTAQIMHGTYDICIEMTMRVSSARGIITSRNIVRLLSRRKNKKQKYHSLKQIGIFTSRRSASRCLKSRTNETRLVQLYWIGTVGIHIPREMFKYATTAQDGK